MPGRGAAFITVNESRTDGDVLRITRRVGSHHQGSTFGVYCKNYVNFPHASARDQGVCYSGARG